MTRPQFTKVQAIMQLISDHGGIADWDAIYENIEKYYPNAYISKDGKAGLRGVLYRDMYKDLNFIKIGNLGFGLKNSTDDTIIAKNIRDMDEYLYSIDFDWENIDDAEANNYLNKTKAHKKLETFDENIMITEGTKKTKNIALYERSVKLRKYAIQTFSDNGLLFCECCRFNFDQFYGSELSRGYIEIHHKKPIFQFEGEDIGVSLKQAISNLAPLCANCHRMVHRQSKNTLTPLEIIPYIRSHGMFGSYQIVV